MWGVVRRGMCLSGAQADVQVGGGASQWRSPREWRMGWPPGLAHSGGGAEMDAVGCARSQGARGWNSCV